METFTVELNLVSPCVLENLKYSKIIDDTIYHAIYTDNKPTITILDPASVILADEAAVCRQFITLDIVNEDDSPLNGDVF